MEPFRNRIGGMEKLTMLDFPNKLAAILFYNGCNLRCPYCYNPSLVNYDIGAIDSEEIMDFLKRRSGILNGIVFSGGECTIWGEKLYLDMFLTKSMGYKNKLDTNGVNTERIKHLVENGVVDYVALDLKCSDYSDNYDKFHTTKSRIFYNTWETLRFLIEKGVDFETRTTVHPDISNEAEISNLLKQLSGYGVKKHYLQFFFAVGESLGNVSQTPRYFDMSKVDTHGIEVELRNVEQNNHRKVLELTKNQ